MGKVVDLVQAGASGCKRTRNFINKACSRKTSGKGGKVEILDATSGVQYELSVPSTNDIPLSSPNGDVIPNNNKFDTRGLLGVQGSVLFFGQSEVQDISGVISVPYIE